MQRLHHFIKEHIEEILAEWETFARTLPMAESMDIPALRDHAREMLLVISDDLATPQTKGEQTAKAKGKSDADEAGPPSTAAQEHGAGRAVSGFTLSQMLSEFRAMRASVIRLWTRHRPQLAASDLDDMTRFNEAIDQAVAESVTQFSENITQVKDRFLAILGHDLRNPLGAIMASASFMLEVGELAEPHRAMVSRIAGIAGRMNQMVSDLLDFTRTAIGGDGIPIERSEMDVTQLVRDVVSEVATRYPERVVTLESDGAMRGQGDYARLTQAVTNLVGNAVQHGSKTAPVNVTARESSDAIVISVRNDGPVIPKEILDRIFEPGVRAVTGHDDGHLGLGLFIVDRIVAAHGGSIDVRSTSEDGTTFTVRLPTVARGVATAA